MPQQYHPEATKAFPAEAHTEALSQAISHYEYQQYSIQFQTGSLGTPQVKSIEVEPCKVNRTLGTPHASHNVTTL